MYIKSGGMLSKPPTHPVWGPPKSLEVIVAHLLPNHNCSPIGLPVGANNAAKLLVLLRSTSAHEAQARVDTALPSVAGCW